VKNDFHISKLKSCCGRKQVVGEENKLTLRITYPSLRKNSHLVLPLRQVFSPLFSLLVFYRKREKKEKEREREERGDSVGSVVQAPKPEPEGIRLGEFF